MASFDGNSRLQTPAIGDKPHQPSSFRFPKREFGNTLVMKRSFQRKWFDRWSWLHYEENLDLAFCFTCFALDLAISGIEDRFNQPGYQTYANVQAILLKAAGVQPYQEELQFVLDFYVLILILYSFQRIWKYFLIVFQVNEK